MINLPVATVFPRGLRGVLRVNSAEPPTGSPFQAFPTLRSSGNSPLMYNVLSRAVNGAVAAQATIAVAYLPAGVGMSLQAIGSPNPGCILAGLFALSDQGLPVAAPFSVTFPMLPLIGSSRFRSTELVPLTGTPWPSATDLPIATVLDEPITGTGVVSGFHTMIAQPAPFPRALIALVPNSSGIATPATSFLTSPFVNAAVSPSQAQIQPFDPLTIGSFNNGALAQALTLAQLDIMLGLAGPYIAGTPFNVELLANVVTNINPAQLQGNIARVFVGAEGWLGSGLRVAPIDLPIDFLDGFFYFPSYTAISRDSSTGPIGAVSAIPSSVL